MIPNRLYDELYILNNLNSFDYVQIISTMFKNWCMSEECWIDLKCLSVCCGCDLNYANCLRTCHVETVYVLWINNDLNNCKMFDEMLDGLVLREHNLAKAFYSMIQ
jgi:hypothetical protein